MAVLNTLKGGGAGSTPVDSGTKVMFNQSVAPAGWTKDTTHNDKILRIVSGSASNGGSQSFSTCFGSGKATQSHTLTTPQIASHTHIMNNVVPTNTSTSIEPPPRNRQRANPNNTQGNPSPSAGGGSHSHSLDLDVSYVDVIIATKD